MVRTCSTSPHHLTCVVFSDAGLYLRRIYSCITQLQAQGPSRTCKKGIEEDETKCSKEEQQQKRMQVRNTSIVRACLHHLTCVGCVDLYWRSLESGDLWYKSRQLKRRFDPTLRDGRRYCTPTMPPLCARAAPARTTAPVLRCSLKLLSGKSHIFKTVSQVLVDHKPVSGLWSTISPVLGTSYV